MTFDTDDTLWTDVILVKMFAPQEYGSYSCSSDLLVKATPPLFVPTSIKFIQATAEATTLERTPVDVYMSVQVIDRYDVHAQAEARSIAFPINPPGLSKACVPWDVPPYIPVFHSARIALPNPMGTGNSA
ncbi:hypothetical protein BT96DRAFT_1005367 [Gymnopus androsaceus JB14]|uniref:Uncharacterized protein n=1 Tax=Gymnopus androsaceus JB14 TaxID=1447944 RepID=A0A6A4GN49_9AGAR|nr:hypothetical protein BT96DRAFT_1005367 [Gymnopus androsaceus JB14]